MKLGNHGWGYRKMIMYSCAIFCCLFVAMFYINRLYTDLQNSAKNNTSNSVVNNVEVDNNDNKKEEVEIIDESYYKNLENDLENATRRYVEAGYIDSNQDLTTITSDRLINDGYLSSLLDNKGNKCSGYSNVIRDEIGVYNIYPYIYCSHYSSDN